MGSRLLGPPTCCSVAGRRTCCCFLTRMVKIFHISLHIGGAETPPATIYVISLTRNVDFPAFCGSFHLLFNAPRFPCLPRAFLAQSPDPGSLGQPRECNFRRFVGVWCPKMMFQYLHVLSVEAGMTSYIGPGPSHGPTLCHGARFPETRALGNKSSKR